MHELSIAFNILDIVNQEARKHKVRVIHEIQLEVGRLSGIDVEALKTGLEIVKKDTLLDSAYLDFRIVPGKGRCNKCHTESEISDLLTLCPNCGEPVNSITGGQELRVLSIIAE
jgi:hydrogenase nickel incorporation protein HypA/HybF